MNFSDQLKASREGASKILFSRLEEKAIKSAHEIETDSGFIFKKMMSEVELRRSEDIATKILATKPKPKKSTLVLSVPVAVPAPAK